MTKFGETWPIFFDYKLTWAFCFDFFSFVRLCDLWEHMRKSSNRTWGLRRNGNDPFRQIFTLSIARPPLHTDEHRRVIDIHEWCHWKYFWRSHSKHVDRKSASWCCWVGNWHTIKHILPHWLEHCWLIRMLRRRCVLYSLPCHNRNYRTMLHRFQTPHICLYSLFSCEGRGGWC